MDACQDDQSEFVADSPAAEEQPSEDPDDRNAAFAAEDGAPQDPAAKRISEFLVSPDGQLLLRQLAVSGARLLLRKWLSPDHAQRDNRQKIITRLFFGANGFTQETLVDGTPQPAASLTTEEAVRALRAPVGPGKLASQKILDILKSQEGALDDGT